MAVIGGATSGRIRLSTFDQRVVASACETLRQFDLVSRTEEFVLEAQLCAARLSASLRRVLLQFRRFGHPSGGLLIGDVPLGDPPATPELTSDAVGTAQPAAAAMSVLLAGLGDQYGFRPEFGGNIVQNIVPLHQFQNTEISVGSAIDLRLHIEMAFSEQRCDYVALLCLRQDLDSCAGTILSSIDAMLPLLDDHTVEVLKQPRFRTKVDRSCLIGDHVDHDIWIEPIAVLSGPARRPHLRVDFAETEGTDPAASAALDALHAAAHEIRITVYLRPGDLLIVDNYRALHGRTPFSAQHDGTDRWLLRSFITKDLRRSEICRPSDARIVEPDYGASHIPDV
jgi:L-asparagine oxygenase